MENDALILAAKALLDHWDEGGKEKKGEFEGMEYWSPAGRMVDTEFIASLRTALSKAHPNQIPNINERGRE